MKLSRARKPLFTELPRRRVFSETLTAPVLLAQVLPGRTPCIGPATSGIHGDAEKESSRKLAYIHPHTPPVPGRRQAGLFTGLPRRVLLGNLEVSRA
jgi:hypothetical protein